MDVSFVLFKIVLDLGCRYAVQGLANSQREFTPNDLYLSLTFSSFLDFSSSEVC
jgi:hypothetical protein